MKFFSLYLTFITYNDFNNLYLSNKSSVLFTDCKNGTSAVTVQFVLSSCETPRDLKIGTFKLTGVKHGASLLLEGQ